MSGTVAADLEREEEASSAGLSAKMRGLSVVGIWRGIAYSENATVGALYPVADARPRSVSTRQRKE